MSLATVFTDVVACKDAIAAGNYKEAWRLQIVVEQDVYNVVYTVGATTADEAEKAKIRGAGAELVAACEAKKAEHTFAAHPPVGKIGDGKILDFIIKFLPLILALL